MGPKLSTNGLMRHRHRVLASLSCACAVVAVVMLIHLYCSHTVSSSVATWAALRIDDEFSQNGKRSNESDGSWFLFVREGDGTTELLTLADPTLATTGYDSLLWVLDRQYHTSWLFPTQARSFVSYYPKADDPWIDRKPIPPTIREQAAALFKQEYGTRAESLFRLLVDEDQPRDSVRWSGYVANGALACSILGTLGFALLAMRGGSSTPSLGGTQRVFPDDSEGVQV